MRLYRYTAGAGRFYLSEGDGWVRLPSMSDKLKALHLILKWTPLLTEDAWAKSVAVIMPRIGEYYGDPEIAYLRVGWILRRITITQAFEESKTMRWAMENWLNTQGQKVSDDYYWLYTNLATALSAWEHAHNKHVPVFWPDED